MINTSTVKQKWRGQKDVTYGHVVKKSITSTAAVQLEELSILTLGKMFMVVFDSILACECINLVREVISRGNFVNPKIYQRNM
jgi:hypothetical protein